MFYSSSVRADPVCLVPVFFFIVILLFSILYCFCAINVSNKAVKKYRTAAYLQSPWTSCNRIYLPVDKTRK